MNNVTVISLADASYCKMLYALVSSGRIYFPEAHFYTVLVNVSDQEAYALSQMNSKCTVVRENIDFNSDLQKRCYCTNRRTHLFKSIRQETDNILIWVDADSIILKSCKDLFSFVQDCDFSARPKIVDGKMIGIAAGTTVFGNSPKACSLIEEYNSMVDQDSYKTIKIKAKKGIPKQARKVWMANQDALYRLYSKYSNSARFKPLPDKYCDVWLRKDGVIWSAKSSKKGNEKYIDEYKKYVS